MGEYLSQENERVIDCSSLVTMRADAFLSHLHPQHSRRKVVERLISLLVDATPVKYSVVVHPRQRVTARFRPIDLPRPLAAELDLPTLYEDEGMLVIDKPCGATVHPAVGMANDVVTVTQGLCARYPELTEWQAESGYRAGVVHRLDRWTSGVLLLAKTPEMAESLRAQFKERTVKKQYIAAAHGQMTDEQGEVRGEIGRDPRRRNRFAIVQDGKDAHTIYKIIAVFENYTMVRLWPVTGRTHQLRVHLRSLGHPVVGDEHYALSSAPPLPSADRLLLHAEQITFTHPASGERLTFSAPLPPLFEQALQGGL